MTQRQLAGEIGVSPSRVNDYLSGRSEPTLKIAWLPDWNNELKLNGQLKSELEEFITENQIGILKIQD